VFWWKPYEALMETKPVAGDVAVVDLVAGELVELLQNFPPRESDVDWSDERWAARYRGRLETLPRLDVPFVETLLRIVCLDLAHEVEQIDWLLRNHHHKNACPTAAHEEALRLLWPVVVEHLYQRKDDCQGILNRAHLAEICDKTLERFRRRALLAPG
jgi:hypothetical protein